MSEKPEPAGPSSGPSLSQPSGRRAGRRVQTSRRRVDLLVALGVALPAVVGLSVAVIGDEDDVPFAALPPSQTGLDRATVICPPGFAADGNDDDTTASAWALRVPDVEGGRAQVRTGEPELAAAGSVELLDTVPVELVDETGPVVLDAEGGAAPGIVAGRREPLVAAPCRAPAYDEWFLGLGASARNASVITLVNPDPTQAVVDVTLLGPRGPIEEEQLRGIPVPGAGTVQVDLAEVAPRRVDLAAHLSVTRGRISATVTHRVDPLGAGRVSRDTLPAQAEPSTESLLLGVDPAADSAVLYLANPGDDEVRVSVRVVNEEAVFTPAGVEDVAVPPRTLARVRLADLVDAQAAEGMLGLQVDATGPVLATVRGLDREDLVAVGAGERLDDDAAVVVPPGKARLVLGGAQRVGVIHVTGYDESGDVVVDDQRVRIAADRAATLDLPRDVVALAIEARNTPVYGAVLISSASGPPGSAVVPIRPAELTARVPVVVPR